MIKPFEHEIQGKPGKIVKPNWWKRMFLIQALGTSDERPQTRRTRESDQDRRKT